MAMEPELNFMDEAALKLLWVDAAAPLELLPVSELAPETVVPWFEAVGGTVAVVPKPEVEPGAVKETWLSIGELQKKSIRRKKTNVAEVVEVGLPDAPLPVLLDSETDAPCAATENPPLVA